MDHNKIPLHVMKLFISLYSYVSAKKRDTGRAFIHLFTPPFGQVKARTAELNAGLPCEIQTPKYWSCRLLPHRVHTLTGSWIGNRVRTQTQALWLPSNVNHCVNIYLADASTERTVIGDETWLTAMILKTRHEQSNGYQELEASSAKQKESAESKGQAAKRVLQTFCLLTVWRDEEL